MILKESGEYILKEDSGKMTPGEFVDFKFRSINRDGVNTDCVVIVRNGTGDTSNYARSGVIGTITETISGDKTDAELISYYKTKAKSDYGDCGFAVQQ